MAASGAVFQHPVKNRMMDEHQPINFALIFQVFSIAYRRLTRDACPMRGRRIGEMKMLLIAAQ